MYYKKLRLPIRLFSLPSNGIAKLALFFLGSTLRNCIELQRQLFASQKIPYGYCTNKYLMLITVGFEAWLSLNRRIYEHVPIKITMGCVTLMQKSGKLVVEVAFLSNKRMHVIGVAKPSRVIQNKRNPLSI